MEANRNLTTGLIESVGHSIGQRDGCEIVTLTEEQEAATQAALLEGKDAFLGADGAVTTAARPAPAPDPRLAQRRKDAATALNNLSVMGIGLLAQRTAFARLIGVHPLSIPETQAATETDIRFLDEAAPATAAKPRAAARKPTKAKARPRA